MFRLFLLICLVDYFNPGAVDQWETFDGSAYAFVDQSLTFDDAWDYCEDLGMDMVAVTSEAEQDFLMEAVYNGDDNQGIFNSWFWIGAYNEAIDSKVSAFRGARGYYFGQWRFTSGETFGPYQDFDGLKESNDWGYDNFGAAIVVTDFDSADRAVYEANWRIAPATNNYKVVCELH